MMTPLKVTIRLVAPMVDRGDPIHLDALLAWSMVRWARPSGTIHDVAWEPEQTVHLPLVKMRYGRDWWYRASAVAPTGERSRFSWVKRFDRDHEDLLDLGNATQLTLKLGRYKDAHVPLELVVVPQLVFWAVGERDRVRRLLKRVTHVGPKASQGYGRIGSFDVERLEVGEAVFDRDWRTPDNRPARNLPEAFCRVRGLDVGGTMPAPLTPPYWRRSEAALRDVPVL